MANIKSSKKRIITSEKSRKRNTSNRSMLRTFLKKVHAAILTGNKDISSTAFKIMQPILDRQASKGLIHKNKAARHKSRLSIKIKKLNTEKI